MGSSQLADIGRPPCFLSAASDPEELLPRWLGMNPELENLRRRMDAAVEALDFEGAGRLRDQISLLRGNPNDETHQDFDTSRLRRQVPGQMGSERVIKPLPLPPGGSRPSAPIP